MAKLTAVQYVHIHINRFRIQVMYDEILPLAWEGFSLSVLAKFATSYTSDQICRHHKSSNAKKNII